MCGCNPDSYTDAGNTDANANAGNTATDAYGDTDTYNYAYSDTIGDPASANAKATAHAVPSADAVSEWIKKLKELKSNRELARQLASSLLFREGARAVKWRGELCEPLAPASRRSALHDEAISCCLNLLSFFRH